MAATRPLKLAIIGAGPSGFYTASRLLSLLPAASQKGRHVEVHMYDRLPTPYGLVRYGVAPDHPEVKNCQEKFDGLACDPRFRFFGNVSIGTTTSPSCSSTGAYTYPDAVHIPLSELTPYYTTVLFSYGSSLSNPLSRTKHSSSSPAPLRNVIPALAFVSWYNGHPAYTHLTDQLLDLAAVEEATVIGHGNVAIDVARMLLKDPDTLARTDMPTSVVQRLRESKVRKVSAVGRRGPAQVSFTTKEFREMVHLPRVTIRPVDAGLMEDAQRMVVGDRPRKRLMELMSKSGTAASGGDREFELGFLKSPIAFLPSTTDSDSGPAKVSHIKWSLNSLLSPPAPPPLPSPHPPAAPATSTDSTPSTTVVARPTGEEITTPAGLVIESVGYRSESLAPPTQAEEPWALPFDEKRGRIMNDGGRVVDDSGIMVPGFYTAGWVASGPIGVIASTMQYAFSVASLIINDHFIQPSSSAFTSPLPITPEPGIPAALVDAGAEPVSSAGSSRSGKRVVEMEDWNQIDRAEIARGKQAGKPREKFLSVRDMLHVLP
ncbi:hypothetical protein QFC19_002746 [Naganishia cerealis]|uniref:Uncharacterized protein n=1 Tax=Naganishia cerealis TaxID=610337 RepID=A0ACC2W949_9TREE|nr:hypothetical protein QFC19_002746 [Naganishia cerealis]